MKWKRYRFITRSDDNRPIVFNPSYPWWESGFTDEYSTIVAFLPEKENLTDYWPEAEDIESTDETSVWFTGRFPQPEYYKPL